MVGTGKQLQYDKAAMAAAVTGQTGDGRIAAVYCEWRATPDDDEHYIYAVSRALRSVNVEPAENTHRTRDPLTDPGPVGTVIFRTSIAESCRPTESIKCLDRQSRSVVDLSAYAICGKRFVPIPQIQLQAHDPRRRVSFLDMVEAFL